MAVSGFSSEDQWREMVTKIWPKKYLQSSEKYLLAQVSCSLASVPHPALRAIFSFLTSKDESYTSVLEEDGLLLVDKLLFIIRAVNEISQNNSFLALS